MLCTSVTCRTLANAQFACIIDGRPCFTAKHTEAFREDPQDRIFHQPVQPTYGVYHQCRTYFTSTSSCIAILPRVEGNRGRPPPIQPVTYLIPLTAMREGCRTATNGWLGNLLHCDPVRHAAQMPHPKPYDDTHPSQ